MAATSARGRVRCQGAAVRPALSAGPAVALPGVTARTTGRQARRLVEHAEGTPAELQDLRLNGVPVAEDVELGALGFVDGQELQLVRTLAGGHCQVPCGIFDDPAMVAECAEDAATIRKAMDQIVELMAGDQTPTSFNQMVRWVTTKEDHCSAIITKMAEYGLAQRCKLPSDPTSPFADDKEYVEALRAHHAVMQKAMKCKQAIDLANADALDAAIAEMGKMYTA